MRKIVVFLLLSTCWKAAWAVPELVVVGNLKKMTTVHLKSGQVLVIQIEPGLEYADPIPGRKWHYQAPKAVPSHLKFLGEWQQGKFQLFRFQCLGVGDELLRLPLYVWKDGSWDGPSRSCDFEVVSP